MQELHITKELEKQLWELGYTPSSFGIKISDAARYLREVKGIHVVAYPNFYKWTGWYYKVYIHDRTDSDIDSMMDVYYNVYDSYDEAFIAGITAALNHLKQTA